MGKGAERYIPAIGHNWLLPLYDPLMRWVMRESTFKQRLINQACIEAGHRVLDLGCGTATLTILVKRLYPGAEVFGLDGDLNALAVALRKAEGSGIRIVVDQGMSYELPYTDGSFDRVLSSLMFHHLTRDHKLSTLKEVRRILRPGGELHVVDFGPPNKGIGSLISRIFHRSERVRDNLHGQLLIFFEEAGFVGVEETGQHTTAMGALSFYRGRNEES